VCVHAQSVGAHLWACGPASESKKHTMQGARTVACDCSPPHPKDEPEAYLILT